jgi:hypothetical protein
LFYFFYHYSFTGERQFTAPIGMLSYYGVPATLATLLLGALRLERGYRINLAILLISLGVSLYAAELFLTFSDTIASASRPIWGNEIKKRKYEVLALAKQFGVNFDTRSKLEVFNDLRAKGIDAVPSVMPMEFLKRREDGLRSELNINGAELLPLGGISNRVTVFCNETGQYLIYLSDEHGFHNPKGIWQSGKSPILALGDSFTLGGCVASDKGFVALIRNRYPGTLNLGMPGEGPLTMLATLKEYGPVMKPNTVLWFYYEESDIEDMHREAQSPLLLRYLESGFSQNLLDRQNAIDQAILGHIERSLAKELAIELDEVPDAVEVVGRIPAVVRLSTVRKKLGLVFGAALAGQPERSHVTEADLELFKSILLEAKAITESWGGTLRFVYLPAWERYGNPETANRIVRYRDRVLTTMKGLEIATVDLHSAFQARGDPLSLFSFRRFGHYNEKGHKVVAEEVLKSVASER